ncbi:uncharacterized protein RB166_014682 [Leptodactylus fuscus]
MEHLPEDDETFDVPTMMASALLAGFTFNPPPLFIMEHIMRRAEDYIQSYMTHDVVSFQFFRSLDEAMDITMEKARLIGLRITESYDEDDDEDSEDGRIYMKLDDGVTILHDEPEMETSVESSEEEPEEQKEETEEETEDQTEETEEEAEHQTDEETSVEVQEEPSCYTCVPARRIIRNIRTRIASLFARTFR